MSRQRLIRTMSFQAGRTIGVAAPCDTACNWPTRSGISLGECSVSSSSQSKPLSRTISAAMLLHRLHHSPIWSSPAAIASLKALRRSSISIPLSHELDRDAAERAEIAVQRVALLREDHASERARQYDVPRLQRHSVMAE